MFRNFEANDGRYHGYIVWSTGTRYPHFNLHPFNTQQEHSAIIRMKNEIYVFNTFRSLEISYNWTGSACVYVIGS